MTTTIQAILPLLAAVAATNAAVSSATHVPGTVCDSWSTDECAPPPEVSVWPQPQVLSVGDAPGLELGTAVGTPLRMTCAAAAGTPDGSCGDVLVAAMARYTHVLAGTPGHTRRGYFKSQPTARRGKGFPANSSSSSSSSGTARLATLSIHVGSAALRLNATLFAGMEESYTLDVPAAGAAGAAVATLRAPTVLGALRGLESFAQLVDFAAVPPAIARTPVTVTDAPRFPWRGLRVDSARHYLPVATIKATLDVMARGWAAP